MRVALKIIWSVVAGATWYEVWVEGHYQRWHEATAICDVETCRLTPDINLQATSISGESPPFSPVNPAYGAWRVGIRSWSPQTGASTWALSSVAYYVYWQSIPPEQLTGGDNELVFSGVRGVTWYQIYTARFDGTKTNSWVLAAVLGCEDQGICRYPLAPGDYDLWIRSYGIAGMSYWRFYGAHV